MPLDEGLRVRGDLEVCVETGVRLADLRLAMLDQQPVPLVGPKSGEVEPNDDAPVRESLAAQCVTHRPERHERIEVLGGDLEPSRSPLAERLADPEQIAARLRELVAVTGAVGLRCRLDDAEPFELLEALGKQGSGEPGRALEDLTEGLAAQMHVADDQRRPPLSEDLRAAGDGAVLTVGPHEANISRVTTVVKSRFRTEESRLLTSSRCTPMFRWASAPEEERGLHQPRQRYPGSAAS